MACVLLVPVLVLSLEIAGGLARSRERADPPASHPRVAIVMPAHNEAPIIAGTLDNIVRQLDAADRLLVVADNCTDDTAVIARAHAVEVIVRSDPDRRGKGYALDFGVRHLASDPPEVVIIIDADCQVGDGAIKRLAHACVQTGRPIQALYLMQAPPGAGLMSRMRELAWRTKNLARPTGLLQWGLPCQLMGTGMAFSWHSISHSQLATGHLVEDLKLGLELAAAGQAPRFCPEALVTSQFPHSSDGERSQRMRWEHGHLGLILTMPRILLRGIVSFNVGLLVLALDLIVPPLALLVLLVALMWPIAMVAHVFVDDALAVWLLTAEAALLACAVLLAWARYGRDIVTARELALAGTYVFRKIPLYVRFLFARQLDWVRSKRDHDSHR